MFVYGVVDAPVTASGKLTGGGRRHVARLLPVRRRRGPRPSTLRIATSLISVDQAKKNLDLEIPDVATRSTRCATRAQDAWDQVLGTVEVEGATDDQLTTLYSNLYRLYLYPNSGFENTGTADAPKYQYAVAGRSRAGPDTPTQTGAKIVDGKVYVNNGFWDTYRTTWPAYSPAHARTRPARWSTGSSSSTRTAAGSPAGPRPATRT